MKMRPLNDRVLVKRSKPEEKAGSIIIPESSKRESRFGEVLAVGPGRLNEKGGRIPVGVQAGQVVYFRAYTGQDVDLDGESGYVILREDEIEGVVEET